MLNPNPRFKRNEKKNKIVKKIKKSSLLLLTLTSRSNEDLSEVQIVIYVLSENIEDKV